MKFKNKKLGKKTLQEFLKEKDTRKCLTCKKEFDLNWLTTHKEEISKQACKLYCSLSCWEKAYKKKKKLIKNKRVSK